VAKTAQKVDKTKEVVAEARKPGEHRHRCPDCGTWYDHIDLECPDRGLAWYLCFECSQKVTVEIVEPTPDSNKVKNLVMGLTLLAGMAGAGGRCGEDVFCDGVAHGFEVVEGYSPTTLLVTDKIEGDPLISFEPKSGAPGGFSD
jgi:hypothetical protein